MRGKRRGSGNWFRWMAALSILAALILIAFVSPVFDVSNVNVSGNSAVPAREVRDVAGLAGSANMFAYRAGKAERALEALPFVKTARVTKAYPNTLNINVAERRPFGYIERSDGQFLLVDDEGVALEARLYMNWALPMITGLDFDNFTLGKPLAADNQAACNRVFEIAALIAPNGLSGDITRVNVSDPDDAWIYAGYTEVRLGACKDLSVKLQDLKSILDSGEIPTGARCSINMAGERNNYVFRLD